MVTVSQPEWAPFGTILGVAAGNVPAYSSDYASADDNAYPNVQSYRSYVDGVYMGNKWRCVEYARRWLYVNRGWVFDEVAMAYDIFGLRTVQVVADGSRLPLNAFRNGSWRHPEPGALLVWSAEGEFATTGHVAVVTEVTANFVRVAEQGYSDLPWPAGQSYARAIPATVSPSGEYRLKSDSGSILGWVVQTSDDSDAEPKLELDPRLFNLHAREVATRPHRSLSWLNMASDDEAAYVRLVGGHKLARRAENELRYYSLSETAMAEIARATTELHTMFMTATDYVLRSDTRLARFDIPRCLWEKIRGAWSNRSLQMIAGRFDLSLTNSGLKVYEYNCDTASEFLECARIQGRWAGYYGCDEGEDAGATLAGNLRAAWRLHPVDGTVHLLCDADGETEVQALFLKSVLESAGIQAALLRGTSGLSWDRYHNIRDPDGMPIRRVWKTIPWEATIDQIRADCDHDEEKLAQYRPGRRTGGPPRLVDVLLRKDVLVHEPIWALIPCNKAILPVLAAMYPGHPYVLRATHALTDELVAKGYVSKPVAGHGGANVRVYGRGEKLLEATDGEFADRNCVYQELFRLPTAGGYNVQISAFCAAGQFAGAGVRIGRSMIIGADSDHVALRVVDDGAILRSS